MNKSRRKLLKKGVKHLRSTYDLEEILEVAKAVEDIIEMESLDDQDIAELRSWAEISVMPGGSETARWVAEKVLILLRDNFNLRKRNNG